MKSILIALSLFLLLPLQAQQQKSYWNQRSRVDELRNKLQQMQEKEKQRERTLSAFQAQMKEIIQTRNADNKIKSIIQLKHKIRDQRQQLNSDIKEQIAVATQMRTFLNADDNIPQVTEFLESSKETLRTIGSQQDIFKNKLSVLEDKLRNSIQNIPSPETFVLANGIKMVKIGKGKEVFYISEKPVAPQGKLTFNRAQEIINQLSITENAPFRLPSTKQIRTLQKYNFPIKEAIWCSDLWEAMPNEQYAIDRFGIKLHTVWDPQECLKRGKLFGELPQAEYPELTAYITTRLATGKKIQKAIVDKMLTEEL